MKRGLVQGIIVFNIDGMFAKAVDAQQWKQKPLSHLQMYVLVHAEVLTAGKTAS